jgi:phosphoribosylanthranilate isomerase
MIVKVCGLKDCEITDQLIESNLVDMVGFNFYPISQRYIDPKRIANHNYENILKVGVFVGEDINLVEDISNLLQLNYVQLHNDEDQIYIDQCLSFTKVIKAIGIESVEDIRKANEFENCSYLLFDKKSKEHGGTGQKFDWSLLKHYTGNIPFLLAGGIGPEDVENIKNIDHLKFAGIDINSRFEISPAVKDVKLIKSFLKNLENEI